LDVHTFDKPRDFDIDTDVEVVVLYLDLYEKWALDITKSLLEKGWKIQAKKGAVINDLIYQATTNGIPNILLEVRSDMTILKVSKLGKDLASILEKFK
jgi:hypothetical protein